jgi:hypothetical protein
LSGDTIVPSYANPQSLNRYSYVLNNPLRYTDPTGHRACEKYGDSCLSENQATEKYKAELRKHKNENKDKGEENDRGGGAYKVLQSLHPDSPILPEWLQGLSNLKLIWSSGPDWFFRVADGKRILTGDHPHLGVPFWHLNSDLRLLPHVMNMEPVLKIAAAAQPVVTSFATFSGAAESFIPIITPRPDMFMPLSGQQEVYN